MKYIKFLLLSFSIFLLSETNLADANTYRPAYIDIKDQTEKSIYKSDDILKLNLRMYDTAIESKYLEQEIGIAKTINKEGIVYFEYIGKTEKLSFSKDKNDINIDFKIPQINKEYSSSSFVVYIKSNEGTEDYDQEFMVVSKPFTLKNNTNATSTDAFIRSINLVDNQGRSYILSHGPTIYNPKNITDSRQATSVNLHMTFETDREILINPTIKYKKLRGDQSIIEEVYYEDTKINKEDRILSLELSNFDYTPGVYTASISFENDVFRPYEFQYIIDGDIISIGKINIIENDNDYNIDFELFGNPTDRDLSIDTRSNKYKVDFIFVNDKGEEVNKVTENIDFSNSNFVLNIDKNSIKNSKELFIKAYKDQNLILENKYDFQNLIGIESLNKNSNNIYIFTYILLILSILIIILAFVFKNIRIKLIILAFIFMSAYLYMLNKAEASWQPTLLGSVSGGFINEGIYERPVLYLSENLSTRTHECNQDIISMARITYPYCNNTTNDIRLGISNVSIAQATNNRIVYSPTTNYQHTPYNNETTMVERYGCEKNKKGQLKGCKHRRVSNGKHPIYRAMSNWTQINLGKPNAATNPSNIYIHITSLAGSNTGVKTGYSNYSIPINNTCNQASSNCTCSGRDLVCNNAGVVSTTTNSTSCKFDAYCSAIVTGTGASEQHQFTFTAIRNIGNVQFKEGANAASVVNTAPFSKTYTKATSTLSLSVNLKDLGDNVTINQTCTVDRVSLNKEQVTGFSCKSAPARVGSTTIVMADIPKNCLNPVYTWTVDGSLVTGNGPFLNHELGLTTQPEVKVSMSNCGQPVEATCSMNICNNSTCTDDAHLCLDKVPKVVNSGNMCKIFWNVVGASNCTLNGVAEANNGYKESIITENKLYTLSCQKNGTTVSTTTKCLLNPNIIEQ